MTKIEKAFEISKVAVSIANQKRIFQEEYDLNLFYFENNGVFKATKELISYVKTIKDLSQDTAIVLLDDNNTPIRIENIETFLNAIVDKHMQANNRFFFQYENLKTVETIESILK
jgi:hypothetical protein